MNCSGKMSFRDFLFPVNPSEIRVTHSRHVTRKRVPFGEDIVGETGTGGRVISGEGELFGLRAPEEFAALKAVFEQKGAGMLYVPSQKPMAAYFEELELVGQDVEGVIRYRFRFVESSRENAPGGEGVVLADGKLCLWDIAYTYGRDIEELLTLNPWVKRPDTPLPVGEEIRLC